MARLSPICIIAAVLLAALPVRAQQGTGTFPAEARKAAQRLSMELKGALTRHMAAGGPAAAITVCADSAQVLTAAVRSATGLAVRRVSTRPRNTKNTPDSTDLQVLAEFERLKAAGELTDSTALTLQGPAGTRRLYVPILTGPFCLTCHGPQESLKPELRTILKQRYPDDRATGYAPGDLRGAIRVAEKAR